MNEQHRALSAFIDRNETWESRCAKARVVYGERKLQADRTRAVGNAMVQRADREANEAWLDDSRMRSGNMIHDPYLRELYDLQGESQRLRRAVNRSSESDDDRAVRQRELELESLCQGVENVVGKTPYLPTIAFTCECPRCHQTAPFTQEFSDTAFVQQCVGQMYKHPSQIWECIACFQIVQLCLHCQRNLAIVGALAPLDRSQEGLCYFCLREQMDRKWHNAH